MITNIIMIVGLYFCLGSLFFSCSNMEKVFGKMPLNEQFQKAALWPFYAPIVIWSYAKLMYRRVKGTNNDH